MKYQILIAAEPSRVLTRKLIKLSDGDTAKYDQLCNAYDKEFQADGKLQECLVGALVDARWRLEHLRTYMDRLRRIPEKAGQPVNKARRDLEMYERRLMKQYEQIFSDLCRYQGHRVAA